MYLMMSQEMWDEDDAEEKYFVGVVEDSVEMYTGYSYEECKARMRSHSEGSCSYIDAIWEWVVKRLSSLNALECFLSSPENRAGSSDVEYFFSHDLPNEVGSYLHWFALGAQLGGLRSWPIADYLCKCFEWGYVPCGWIGPLPEDGGDPDKCIHLLALSRET
ncbi:MAG: hypothetical protein CSB44_05120 [Gammaproteobacteria bacterium]|nr:MAG: hypothetical protein CSB44_05120 [Gammaproteobacteria bacterium]PIE36783.1 MAG: hypothetical protein CSA54_03285 [Gammaproteobacteria bacterium]